MKILQIIPLLDIGGAETMCENLTYELIRQGHDVTVVSLFTKDSVITERMKNRGVRICFLDKKMGLDLSMIPKLHRLFKQEKPDAIHVHLYLLKYVMPALVGLKKPKVVHTVHNMAQMESGRLDQTVNRHYYKRRKAIPVALSSEIQKTVTDLYGLKSSEVPVIFNGIYQNSIFRKDDYSSDHFRIISVARLSPQKNHRRMLRSFRLFLQNVPDAELYLAGNGELLSELQNYANELKIAERVHFLGNQSEIGSILKDYDCFLLTSDYEGMPMSIAEAMCAGLPVVATNVGGIPDMIADGIQGLLTETDEAAISKSLYRVYESESLRKNLGEAAKIASVRFSVRETAQKYIYLYQS